MKLAPREHELKCWPEFFRAILSGAKTFELRRDDRGFRVYDVLWLREWQRLRVVNGVSEGQYTGRDVRRTVTYVLSGMGLEPDMVCMGLAPSEAARLSALTDAVRVFRTTAGRHTGPHDTDARGCKECELSYVVAEAELDRALEANRV